MKAPRFLRRHLFQLGFTALIVIIGIVMFIIGRQHTMLLDNKTIEVEGTVYQALPIVNVAVDKNEPIELAARDRDKVEVMGQRHTITVTYTDQFFEEHQLTVPCTIPIDQNMVLINIPALVGGAESSVWLQMYTAPTLVKAPSEEEPVITDDLTIPLGDF